MSNYPEPANRLLTLGRPEPWDLWLDYACLGLRREHDAALIRMATDPVLLDSDGETPEGWGPLHAWRALGQLGAAEAIDPLLSLLPRIDSADDEVVGEDLPIVFGRFGIAVLDRLVAYVIDTGQPLFARVAAAEGIRHIGMNPADRDAAAAALARLLDRGDMDDPTLNAFLVTGLCELSAKQHLASIERAFERGRVEERTSGRLPHVRAKLGVQRPAAPRRRFLEGDIDRAIDEVLPSSPPQVTPEWMKDFFA